VRREYRAVWIQNLSVRVTFGNIGPFCETYLAKSYFLEAPKLVQIVWDHGTNNFSGLGHSITPLLLLCAQRPDTRVDFVPFKLVQ
jgi:hypothetical protein